MLALKRFSQRSPFLFSLAVMVVVVSLMEIHLEPLFRGFLNEQSASYLSGILTQGTACVLMVVLLAKLGEMRSAGFIRPKEWKKVWLVWPMLVIAVLNGSSLFMGEIQLNTSNLVTLILYFILFLSVGLVEEILLRGIVLNVLLQKWGTSHRGVYRAVFVSSLIFGMLHILNLLTGRYELLPTLTQIGFAFFFGVFFGACFIRTKAIWPLIVMHAFFDMCGNFNEIAVESTFGKVMHILPQDALIAIVLTAPLFIYGLIVLRKAKPEKSIPATRAEQLASDTSM